MKKGILERRSYGKLRKVLVEVVLVESAENQPVGRSSRRQPSAAVVTEFPGIGDVHQIAAARQNVFCPAESQ